MSPPSFNDDFRFSRIIEPFDVQAFIAQSAIEAFASGILPWTSRFDIERVDPVGGELLRLPLFCDHFFHRINLDAAFG